MYRCCVPDRVCGDCCISCGSTSGSGGCADVYFLYCSSYGSKCNGDNRADDRCVGTNAAVVERRDGKAPTNMPMLIMGQEEMITEKDLMIC